MEESYKNKANIISWISRTENDYQKVVPTRHFAKIQLNTNYEEEEDRNENAAVSKPSSPVKSTGFKSNGSSGSGNGTPATSGCAQRIVANPYRVQTQIAKISYKSNMETIGSKVPSGANQPNVSPKPETAAKKQRLQKEFEHRKEEREKEAEKLKTILNEMSFPLSSPEVEKPTASNYSSNVPKKPNHVHFVDKPTKRIANRFQRSKTDVDIAQTSGRNRQQLRTGNAQVRSKSSHELLLGTEHSCRKKTAYDVQEARRYMVEQRKKRLKQNYLCAKQEKSVTEKEEIKKRLENLRKSTRQIINKNVQKKQIAENPKDIAVPELQLSKLRPPNIEIQITSPNKLSAQKKPITCKVSTRITAQRTQRDITIDIPMELCASKNSSSEKNDPIQTATVEDKQKLETNTAHATFHNDLTYTQHEPQQLSPKDMDCEIVTDHQQQITVTRDHTETVINSVQNTVENCEQEVIKVGAGKEQTTTSSLQSVTNDNAKNDYIEQKHHIGLLRKGDIEHSCSETRDLNVVNLNMPIQSKKPAASTVHIENAQDSSDDSVAENTPPQLEMPAARLTTSIESTQLKKSSAEAERQCQNGAISTRSELPFWLKPSPVQVYPYSFIVAVRRKLETIVNPSRAGTQSTNGKAKAKQATDSARNTCTEGEEQYDVDKPALSQRPTEFDSMSSEINTKLSSISPPMQLYNNTESEFSPLKTDTAIKPRELDDDATTVSSSILNSPEKKATKKPLQPANNYNAKVSRPVSPLSLDSIEQLKITSRSNLNQAITSNYIKVQRGNRKEQQHQKKPLTMQPSTIGGAITTDNVDFNQFLLDFNRSLNQVIQVNEQLKTKISSNPSQASTCDNTNKKKKKKTSNNDISIPIAPLSSSSVEYTTDFETSSGKEKNKRIERNQNGNRGDNISEYKFDNLKDLHHSRTDNNGHQLTASFNGTVSKLSEDFNSKRKSRRSLFQNQESHPTTPLTDNETASTAIDERIGNSNREINSPSAGSSQQESNGKYSPRSDEQRINSIILAEHSSNGSHAVIGLSDENRRSENEIQPTRLERSRSAGSHISSSVSGSAVSLAASSQTDGDTTTEPTGNIADIPPGKSDQRRKEGNSVHSKQPCGQLDLKLATFRDKSITESTNRAHESPQKSNNAENIESLQKDSSPSCSATAASSFPSYVNTVRGDGQPAGDGATKHDEFKLKAEIRRNKTRASALSTYTDDQKYNNSNSNSEASVPPPVYKAIADDKKKATKNCNARTASQIENATTGPTHVKLGSEIVAILNQSECELSIVSSNSESSVNYSNVGMYEKLIKNETAKSEQLAALLKLREKVLLDRTKSQIAWLEMQKERYKSKGLVVQIAAIKKKQRGILMKMEKEREEIKRLLQSTSTTTTTFNAAQNSSHLTSSSRRRRDFRAVTAHVNTRAPSLPLPPLPPLGALSTPPITPRTTKAQRSPTGSTRSSELSIVRGNYALEATRSLEELLQKRELDLRRRREYVERLMQWHQRLDQEEAEVLQLEQMLLNCNNAVKVVAPITSPPPPVQSEKNAKLAVCTVKMERRLKEIDKSLRELSNISAAASSHNIGAGDSNSVDSTSMEYVRTTGSKLNKLWRRLTSQQVEKFEPCRRYKLCKTDLESIYEEAKVAVLNDFAQDEERIAAELLDKSSISNCSRRSVLDQAKVDALVPPLNLSACSVGANEATDEEEEEEDGEGEDEDSITENSAGSVSFKQQNYSPSAAEEDFNGRNRARKAINHAVDSASDTDADSIVSSRLEHTERAKLIERNIAKFLELTKMLIGHHNGLQRSLSDTQIATSDTQQDMQTSTQSQRNIPMIYNQTRTSTATLQSLEISDSSESVSIPVAAPDSMRSSAQSIASQSPTASTASVSSAENLAHIPITHTNSSTHDANTTAGKMHSHSKSLDMQTHQGTANSRISTISGRNPAASHTSLSMRSTSSSLTSIAYDSESKAREISAKLEQISFAMNELSKANLLPTYESTKTQTDSSSNISVSKSTSTTLNSPPAVVQSQCSQISNSMDEKNVSTDILSYSNNFENISTDMLSPSGCTLKPSSTVCSGDSDGNGNQTQSRSSLESCTSQSKIHTTDTNAVVAQVHLADSQWLPDRYEADFESGSDETRIEDISMPEFETTINTTFGDELELSKENQLSVNSSTRTVGESDSRTITAEIKETSLPHITLPPTTTLLTTTQSVGISIKKENGNSNSGSSTQLMPDILNELETRRCQQAAVVQQEQLKTVESAASPQLPPQPPQPQQYTNPVPYMYVREAPIKNKPPPPYVPPAPGSPMTAIFPAESRIKEITYRRTHEIYCQLSKTDHINAKGEKLPSVMDEQITNIYERIVLDICREYLEDHNELLTQGDPTNFHSHLAFFNPPDRLRCIQDSIYKEVRRCLAMDRSPAKRTQTYSVYGHRAKRDHIGKIIIQEMYEEDDMWCNFHREENEVLVLMIEEMIEQKIQHLVQEIWVAEGGTLPVEQSIEIGDTATGVESIEQTTITEDAATSITESVKNVGASSVNSPTTPGPATTKGG